METYIGTKIVKAEPMKQGEFFSKYRKGSLTPQSVNWSEEDGYLVIYPDQYKSWSPKDVFEAAYKKTAGMPFGLAIEAMKKGAKVARKGWNGKNMFIVYMSPLFLPPYNTADTNRKVNDRTAKWIGEDTPLDSQGYFAMFTANKQWQPGWLASQADMLADDWEIL